MNKIPTISITEVKRNWGTTIRLVQSGSTFSVTVRGKAKARLSPPLEIKKSKNAQRICI